MMDRLEHFGVKGRSGRKPGFGKKARYERLQREYDAIQNNRFLTSKDKKNYKDSSSVVLSKARMKYYNSLSKRQLQNYGIGLEERKSLNSEYKLARHLDKSKRHRSARKKVLTMATSAAIGSLISKKENKSKGTSKVLYNYAKEYNRAYWG